MLLTGQRHRTARNLARGIALGAMLFASAIANAEPASDTRPIDPQTLANLPAFVDGVMAQQIATRQVAGAVVTVVYHGKVLFTRGYGYANIEERLPVDPERTLFHPGSVSKLFTWTALMQQVEAGRVDLDADVNTYLDFKIPDFGSTPIRVRDLMSHSPGMSDEGGFIFYDINKNVPYQQWIKQHIPERVWKPGTEIAYSNYGAALAGYIVERVSGEPYPDYVENHIFKPLGMTSTTFREPLPDGLRQRLATGYKVTDGQLTAKTPEYLSSIMPAGSSSATAPDMARFIVALLNGGALGSARILRPESVKLFESDTLANAPDLPGLAHGLLVYREAGPRLLGHAGNTVDFHSDLVIAPDLDIGYFVSESGGEGSSLGRYELSAAITGQLFPEERAPRWTQDGPLPPLGMYRSNRRDYTKPAEPRHDIKVVSTGPHTIALTLEGETTAWVQIGPLLYEKLTGARDGGPFDRIEFWGPANEPRLSFASEPYEAFHLVRPVSRSH